MEGKRNVKRKRADSSNGTNSKGECPSCLQIPRGKIFQCANGHSMCESCANKVIFCPTCQSPGVTIRNLLAESLLDDQKFKCKWGQQGCKKIMKRNMLSAHEDACDYSLHSPDSIKFCSNFPEARNCPYKFTAKWLSEPKHCANFKKHVTTCLDVINFKDLQYGKRLNLIMYFKDIMSKKYNPKRLAHHSYPPVFFRLPAPSGEGKKDLLCLFLLLNVDSSENRFVSFAFVQLTPETGKMVVELEIDDYSSSRENSDTDSGQVKLSPLKWTMKPMGFNHFLKMVEKPSNTREPEMPLPFFVPVSFLMDHYSSDDKSEFCVRYTVNLMN